MTDKRYHYSGELPYSAIADPKGGVHIIRREDDGSYVIWIGDIQSDERVGGPIAFARREDAQAWIDEMTPLMPDGVFSVVRIRMGDLLYGTSATAPTVVWTRKDGSYGYISLANCLKHIVTHDLRSPT